MSFFDKAAKTNTTISLGRNLYFLYGLLGGSTVIGIIIGWFNPMTEIIGKPLSICVAIIIVLFLSILMISIYDHFFGKKSHKKIEFIETYIEFSLEKQKTNDHTQVVLVAKSNIQNFRFSNIEHLPSIAQNAITANVPCFIDVMLETINPIEHYIIDIEALNTKLQPAAQTLFRGKHHAIVVRIVGDIDTDGGKYKISAKKSLAYDKV